MRQRTVNDDLRASVKSDIAYLRTELAGMPTHESLVRQTAILRRLLVDGTLQRYRSSLGLREIAVQSLDVVAQAQTFAAGTLRLLVGGPIEIGHLTSSYLFEVIGPGPKPAPDVLTTLPLSRFLKAAAILFNGRPIARMQVIKYFANKLGGVHLDPKRDDKTSDGRAFIRLDEIRATIGMVWPAIVFEDGTTTESYEPPRGPAYYALLAIGQAVVASPDLTAMTADAAPTATG